MDKDFSFFFTPPTETAPTIQPNGDKHWQRNGKLHRDNGPAIETHDGAKEYFRDGKRHRIGAPAIERPNGDKEWYENGQRHRIDGPALHYTDGKAQWFLRDVELTPAQITQQMIFTTASKPKPPGFPR